MRIMKSLPIGMSLNFLTSMRADINSDIIAANNRVEHIAADTPNGSLVVLGYQSNRKS